jgi:hypothetical protein
MGTGRPGRGVDHPSSSSAEVKERVELYLYSPSGPSWPVLGRTLPFFLFHPRVNTPSHRTRAAQPRTDFLLVGGQYAPPCVVTEASLPCSQGPATLDFIRSHLIPLNTPTPCCFKMHFNIIIPKVACWFLSRSRVFSLAPSAHTGRAPVVAQLVVQNFFSTPYTNSYFLWQFKNSYATISPNKFTNFQNVVWIDRSSWSPSVRFIFNTVSSFSKWFRPTEHPWLWQTFIPKLCLKPGKYFRRNDTFLHEKFDNYTLRNTAWYCLHCHLDCTWWLRRRGTRLVWVASLNMS